MSMMRVLKSLPWHAGLLGKRSGCGCVGRPKIFGLQMRPPSIQLWPGSVSSLHRDHAYCTNDGQICSLSQLSPLHLPVHQMSYHAKLV